MQSSFARYPLQAIVFATQLAVLLSTSRLSAQVTTADIVGTVTDASGAVVPGASITALNESTGQTRKVDGDTEGYFILPNLPASTYKITAQRNGFGLWESTGIPISVGQERTLKVILQPAAVTTEVTVSGGELSVLDTSSAAVLNAPSRACLRGPVRIPRREPE